MMKTWRSELWQRFAYLWWLKALLSTGLMYGFFVVYFYLLHHPAFAVITVPATWFDEWVRFSPNWLWPYVSLWVYVSLPAAFLRSISEAKFLLCGMCGLLCVGLGIFYVCPTRVEVAVSFNEGSSVYSMLRSMDTSGNSCPSLHVASAVFAAVWLYDLWHTIAAPRSLQVLSVLWCALIVYSTMALKQHVWWDVFGGFLLGLLFAYMVRWARISRYKRITLRLGVFNKTR
ncbi:MAG: phosphatase PAP2 family protein [Formosimonas sp.]